MPRSGCRPRLERCQALWFGFHGGLRFRMVSKVGVDHHVGPRIVSGKGRDIPPAIVHTLIPSHTQQGVPCCLWTANHFNWGVMRGPQGHRVGKMGVGGCDDRGQRGQSEANKGRVRRSGWLVWQMVAQREGRRGTWVSRCAGDGRVGVGPGDGGASGAPVNIYLTNTLAVLH